MLQTRQDHTIKLLHQRSPIEEKDTTRQLNKDYHRKCEGYQMLSCQLAYLPVILLYVK